MRRNNSETLSAVVRQFLRANGLETPLNQHRVINRWPEVVGEQVAQQTEQLFIKNQTLYVRIASPALRANIQLQRRELATRLNRAAGADVITDVTVI